MTKGRPGRQQRKDHRPQTSSIDGSGLANLPADALRRRVDTIIQATRARDLKLKKQGTFEFLKSGLGPPALKSDAFETTIKRIAQAKRLKPEPYKSSRSSTLAIRSSKRSPTAFGALRQATR